MSSKSLFGIGAALAILAMSAACMAQENTAANAGTATPPEAAAAAPTPTPVAATQEGAATPAEAAAAVPAPVVASEAAATAPASASQDAAAPTAPTTPVVASQDATPVSAQPAQDAETKTATESAAAAGTEAGEDATTDPSTIETAASDPTDQGAIPGAKAVTNVENKISITLDDVEMIDVVRMFTRISGVNIIASASNLTGRVTVNLVDVEWKPALESILDMHSLELIEKTPGSGVFSIMTKTPGAPPPMLVETIFLKYATVSNVQPVVSVLVAEYKGTVSVFPAKNALVIRTTSANLGEVKQVIEKIDKLRDQVFIEAKFMELADEAIKDLGINWQSLQGYGVGVNNMSMSYSDAQNWSKSRTDTVNQYNNKSSVDLLEEKYDEDGVTQPEFNQTQEFKDLNEDGDFADAGEVITSFIPARTITDTISAGEDISSVMSDTFADTLSQAKTALLSASDFSIVLAALKQMNGVTIVSNPKIIVANEQPATIHVGTRFRPWMASIIQNTTSSGTIYERIVYNPGEPLDVGVKLVVTPTVNTESNITVKIEPELTRVVRDDTAPTGQTYPVVGTKRISTVFCLENGKTVAIGGLTETEERDQESKIPLLGDIPLIGKYLFSYTHKEKSQSETIIFVTVGLATPESVQRESGLPEDTELARKKLISNDVRKKQRETEIRQLQEAAASEDTKSSKQKERLMRRVK